MTQIAKEQIENGQRLSNFSAVYKINDTTVVKTGPDTIVRLTEAETMKFVLQNTSIPVPAIRDAYRDETTGHAVIIMDYVHGESLDKAWAKYTDAEQQTVIAQLKDYMAQLRTFKSSKVGCIAGTPCHDQYFYGDDDVFGPYHSEDEFNNGIAILMKKQGLYTFIDWHCDVWTNTMKGHDIVLTHNDFDPRNILVQGTKVVSILDWEFSGYYPEYWEYCKAVSCPDWEHPWSQSHAVDQIMQPYYKEIAVFWTSREVLH